MEVNKIISHALQSMPPSKRQKAFAKDTSKLIHMGLNENNYGMSPKAVAALEDSMAGSHFYPDFAAVLLKQKVYAVQEVAEMVGYNDIPTFRKHFVDTFGSTPSTYANSTDNS